MVSHRAHGLRDAPAAVVQVVTRAVAFWWSERSWPRLRWTGTTLGNRGGHGRTNE